MPDPDAFPPPSPGGIGQAKVLLVIVGLVVLVGAGWLISSLSQQPQVAYTGDQASATTDGTYTDGTSTDGTTSDSSGGEPDATVTQMSDSESYDALMSAYNRALELGDQVGKARTDGTYGGTGFAYDVFNGKIGDSDSGVRQELVDECSSLLETVQSAKSEAEAIEVSDTYQQDKQEVVDLYGLLVRRAEILLDAAQVALDSPDESSWRPVLTPASTDARVAYQNAIDGARPNQY